VGETHAEGTSYAASVVGASKRFGSTAALRDVSIDLRAGEIHALVGENGAGKSTLIKLITGLVRPDDGHLVIAGERVELKNPADALARGVGCIYQEPLMFPDLTVSENIFAGRASGPGRSRLVRWREMHEQAAEILGRLDVDVDPRAPASQLTVGAQQAVEIAKAMSRDVRILIMDEPTAALSAHETTKLFRRMRSLAEEGVAILFVSHRLDEVFELSGQITVLRDGRHISTRPTSEVTETSLVSEMVGRKLDDFFRRVPHEPGDIALQVEGLERAGAFEGVTFDVREGEVLGFAGLVGSGRTEVAEALFGISPAEGGVIKRGEQTVEIRSPRQALAHGIAYVPEDRRKTGLALPQSISANITLPSLRRFTSPLRFIRRGDERAAAKRHQERLGIRAASIAAPVSSLSGGNQQKVLLAKWLELQPRVLILDEPTRGVDVGAKADVHALIGDLARSGVAVILISSDLPEVLAMSDRILVMREGRQVGTFAGSDLQQERIMAAAVGVA
jgi:rhamnose transport system ATP-binding protein